MSQELERLAHDLNHRRGEEKKEKGKFQESGQGVELDSDVRRKLYPSLAQAGFCRVTSCDRQGTPCGLVLLELDVVPKVDVHPWPTCHSQARTELELERGALELGGGSSGILSTEVRLSTPHNPHPMHSAPPASC